MIGLVVLALGRAAFADAGAQLADGRYMRALARHRSGSETADFGAFDIQRHAVEHVFRMHIAQTGGGAEVAEQGAARAGCYAFPVAGLCQRGGCVKHVTPFPFVKVAGHVRRGSFLRASHADPFIETQESVIL